jgi:hypothetical protein
MILKGERKVLHLDALGLFLAGLINTFLALPVYEIVLGPGTVVRQPDVLLRATWIAENTLRWQGGWLFWFAVTLSFAWSYFALGRHLKAALPWCTLAIGVALIAATLDLVGVMVNITIVPDLAYSLINLPANADAVLPIFLQSMQTFADTLTNVVAYGLYSFAGLLLLPALFTTAGYPRWLVWLGVVEWSIAALASILLVSVPGLATAPLLVSFALYAPWVWGSALWILRTH